MFDEVTGTPTVARTSNLNEELGQVGHLLVRPKTIVFGRTYVLRMMFFYLFFFQARDLRDAWADRREILHDGRY